MLRALTWTMVLGLLPVQSLAFTVEFDVQPRVARVGEPVTATFTVRGLSGAPVPRLPAIDGFTIRGPDRQQSFSIVNFQMDRSETFTYRLMPLKPGTFTFGPYTYEAKGESANIPALTLKVLAPGGSGEGTENQEVQWSELLFATLTADRNEVYNQEYFDITLSIYSKKLNVGGELSLLGIEDAGLNMQPFRELQSGREIVENEVYDVRRFRSKVRAITEGAFALAPTVRVQILVPSNRRRRSIFDDPFFSRVFQNVEKHPVELKPQPLDIVVKGLPEEGRPAGFSGAVGRFGFNVQISPTNVSIGDPITMQILVQGEGNIESVSPTPVQAGPAFKVYEPKLLNKDINETRSAGRKVFEQVLIPKTATATEVPAIRFSFFDPEKGRYQEAVKGPFPISVVDSGQGTARVIQGTDDGRPARELKVLGDDIAYLKSAPSRWRHRGERAWFAQRRTWYAAASPLFLLAALFAMVHRRDVLRNDVARARKLRAPKVARDALHTAERALAKGEFPRFYEAISDALTRYFGNRLNLSPGEVTGDRVHGLLVGRGVDEELVDSVTALFETCDQRRFGALSSREEEDLETGRRLVHEVNTVFKRCERTRI